MANVTWMIPGYTPSPNFCLSEELDYYMNRVMQTLRVPAGSLMQEGFSSGFLQMLGGQPLRPSHMHITQELYNDLVEERFVSGNVSTLSDPNPEATLEVYRMEPESGREVRWVKEPPPWSRKYKRQNQHLFKRKR
jgi:hypothetical protein